MSLNLTSNYVICFTSSLMDSVNNTIWSMTQWKTGIFLVLLRKLTFYTITAKMPNSFANHFLLIASGVILVLLNKLKIKYVIIKCILQ
jgi:hypothetical protein